jgi:carbon monoxide dehydrogenase subunit G
MVTRYKGELVIERMDPQKFELELIGKGLDVKGKGSASMKMTGKLRALNQGTTEVEGSSEINLTGVMAQFGSRVVEEVSHRMFEQFTQSLRKNIEGMESGHKELTPNRPLNAIPVLATAGKTAILDFFRRITRRSGE